MFQRIFLTSSLTFLSLGSLYNMEGQQWQEDQSLKRAIESLNVDEVKQFFQNRQDKMTEDEFMHYLRVAWKAEGKHTGKITEHLAQISGWSGIANQFGAMSYFPFWLSARKWVALDDKNAGWLECVKKPEAPIIYSLNVATSSMVLAGGAFTLITTLLYKYYAHHYDKSVKVRRLLEKNTRVINE
jgi:hypothetical protein